VALVEKFGGENTICPEMPKCLSELAPRRQQTHRFGMSNDDRLDSVLADLHLLVLISDPYLASTADPRVT
jgi:hypothetical protein